MNRPRNRNNTTGQAPRGRGRARGSSSRGSHDFQRQPYSPVPSAAQVVPGRGVSIILKIDQAIGRQVQGIIAEVLGRGEHPRGIKVRLVDGRVGRVQAMVSEDVASEASRGLEGLGRNGEVGGMSGLRVGRGGRFESTDVRDGFDYESVQGEREEPSLMDYVVTKAKGRGKGRRPHPTEDDAGAGRSEQLVETTDSSDTIMCPVCDAFEGDRQAVEHHVNEHFT